MDYADENYFVPTDLALGSFFVGKEKLLADYHALKRLPIKKRLRKIADDLIASTSGIPLTRWTPQFPAKSETASKKCFGLPIHFPFIYVKMYSEGAEQDYKSIQHVLVDEMQDYTPIQYAVLAKLFSCNMTILGDSHQSVNPYSSSSMAKIQPYFAGCQGMELCRSYRSTIEISGFTQKILENKKLIPIERHGDIPTITVCRTPKEQLAQIQHLIEGFRQSEYAALGIICKSQQQARLLFAQLHGSSPRFPMTFLNPIRPEPSLYCLHKSYA